MPESSGVPGGVVSPPDVTSPSSNPSAAPSATITPTHFPHKPSNTAPVRAFLDTATPALNTVPLELDSTPVSSPVSRQGNWKDQLPAIAAANNSQNAPGGAAVGGEGDKVRLRANDPAVMPAPPGTPGAEDFEAAKTDVKADVNTPS